MECSLLWQCTCACSSDVLAFADNIDGDGVMVFCSGYYSVGCVSEVAFNARFD